ncbi:MAG: Na-translocating system protein MpsB, partial [Gammaproteobacteria bacterium]
MTLPLGQTLQIRAMTYLAGEPIPNFWPMRSFIHHNPLHGLEHLPFAEAVAEGTRMFHADGFLKRVDYQRYLRQGRLDQTELASSVDAFVSERDVVSGVDLGGWLFALLTETDQPVVESSEWAQASDVRNALHGRGAESAQVADEVLVERLRGQLLGSRPVYEAVDALYGTEIG